MKELLLFQAGNIQFGLNLPLVKSIHGLNVRFAEQAGRSHRLVQVLDGEEFPLYDLPSILADETPSGDPMSQKVILLDANQHPIALGVDRVEQVVSFSSDHIHPLPPIFNGLSLSCFPQVLKREDALILLLNPEEIENLEPKTPDTEIDTPNPGDMKPSLEASKAPGPIARVDSDINDMFKESSQKPETADGDPAPDIPHSDSTPPGEIERDQFQPEESIPSDEQKLVESKPSASGVGLEHMAHDIENSDTHDTTENTVAADIDEIAAGTSPDKDRPETGLEDDHFKAVNEDPATKNYDGLPGETPLEEEKYEVDEENRVISSIGINLDSTDEFSSPLEEEKPVDGDVLSQVAAGQPEEIGSLKDTENAVELQEPESNDHPRSAKEEKNMPPLPAGNVPYLFAAVSTESEPTPIEPAEEVSLKEAEAKVETLEEESTDPFLSVKEDKDIPPLPVGEVPYLFAAVSTESEPTPIEPAEEASLKEAETAVEIPEPESNDYPGSAEEDAATLLMPVSEEPSLVDVTSIESEPISKESSHVILLDSSDIVTPASGNRSEKVLTPPGLTRKFESDQGKPKGSYRGPVATGMLVLVALLLLLMWLWPNRSFKIPEVIRKPIPMVYAVREVRENPEELLQTQRPFETENQVLSQTPQPSNTGEKVISAVHTSQKAGEEIFKIETNDFTLTVERPTVTEKNGRPSANVVKTGNNEYSHIVVKDDTLWQIAKQYLDDPFRYPELAERSRISNPDRIYPGDVVRIIKKNEQRKGNQGKSL